MIWLLAVSAPVMCLGFEHNRLGIVFVNRCLENVGNLRQLIIANYFSCA